MAVLEKPDYFSDDLYFIETALPKIEGWLWPEAALLSAVLLRGQTKAEISGPLLEIGVWRGKYLSLLYRCSTETVIGIDTFGTRLLQEIVRTHIKDTSGSVERLVLIRSDSTKITPSQILAETKNSLVRWISIDGSHEAKDVLSDLKLSESLLAGNGVIAIDDFLNSRAIGVSEGTYNFFSTRIETALPPLHFAGISFL